VKDKEPAVDVKEVKSGVEGVYAAVPRFIQQIVR
jgi:hypothetical protein